MLHDTAFATATSLAVVVVCLLLVLHPVAAQQMLSLSMEDTAWRPSDSHRILVSPNRDFAAGFRPDDSLAGKYRFAVWVVASNDGSSTPDDDAVIWYAAHRSSYSAVKGDRTSALAVDAAGRLSWIAAGSIVIWSPVARPAAGAAAVLLLNDTGSLVYGGGSWSSFEEPTDTVMAGQAIRNEKTTLQSASGRYRLTRAGTLQLGDQEYARIPPLLNLTDDGTLVQENSKLVATDVGNTTLLRRLTLGDDGNLRLYSMVPKLPPWRVVWRLLQDVCIIPGTCAAGSICVPVGADNIDCVCPPGYRNFTTRSPCLPKVSYSGRGDDDKFVPLDLVTFSGNGSNTAADHGPLMTKLQQPKNLEECQETCRRDRRCVAFRYKLDGSRTCLLYWGLVDGYWDPVVETTTYLRVAKSNNDSNPFDARLTEKVATACSQRAALPEPKRAPTTMSMPAQIALIATLFGVELLVGALSVWVFLRKYSRYREAARTQALEWRLPAAGGPRRFSYAELKAATRGFSHVVGRGAYGTVYRGDLPDRRVVAVKQLRGVDGSEPEFWAELSIVARMHHLNLVRMWGFCADQDQRMLVYEYVPNGSLDRHLFAPSAGNAAGGGGSEEEAVANSPPLLDLHTRYRIALGVARAIAYLHEECLEWVLHCDIKPENILLDDDFCPKVSDFGVSKLIRSKQDRVTMSRIRGTRGYMAPEWVMHGHPITAKADVYSFGMVLLEILSGRRACDFHLIHYDSEEWYFPKWAYEKAYEEPHIHEIVDPRLAAASHDDDATIDRMLKTAMWCLQDHAEMRPSMGKVAKMLDGSVDISKPFKPTIFCLPDHDVTTSTPDTRESMSNSLLSNLTP